MIIAIPATEDNILCPHFGHAPYFAIIAADESTHAITTLSLLQPTVSGHEALPLWLKSLGVELLIAGGIGKPAIENLREHNINVVCGAYEHPCSQVVSQYLSGNLLTSPKECDHKHDHACDTSGDLH